jgi:hypothetical protein
MKKHEILVGSKQEILDYIKPFLHGTISNNRGDLLTTISGIETQINDLKNKIGMIFYLKYDYEKSVVTADYPEIHLSLEGVYVHIKENSDEPKIEVS